MIEAPDAQAARAIAPLHAFAEAAVRALPGVASVQAVSTAHGPAETPRPPGLALGQHSTPPQGGAQKLAGIDRVIVIGSGKGGMGKSSVSSNLAVALARQGRRVGLLDADRYCPSQPRMMGVSRRPGSPDGNTLQPITAHGVSLMSLGLLLQEDGAVIWRGPISALQQPLTQVASGPLDVLLIDLPPGTGDIQLTLCQRTQLTGAILVSTPQDVAMLDARKALDMFAKLKTPVIGLIENMFSLCCPQCGPKTQIFGHDGGRADAAPLDLRFPGDLPLTLDVRLAGEAGTPSAASDAPEAAPCVRLARRLIAYGMA